jgi:hypothetical protein
MRIDIPRRTFSKTTPDIGDYQRDRNGTDDVKRSVAKDSGGMDPSRGTPSIRPRTTLVHYPSTERKKHVDNLCRVNLVPVHRQTMALDTHIEIRVHLEAI